MNSSGRMMVAFLTGLGVGVGIALLTAPQSGEDTREWLAENAEDELKRLRRKGRQSIDQLQDAVSRGEDKVSKVLKTSRSVLDSVASKLD